MLSQVVLLPYGELISSWGPSQSQAVLSPYGGLISGEVVLASRVCLSQTVMIMTYWAFTAVYANTIITTTRQPHILRHTQRYRYYLWSSTLSRSSIAGRVSQACCSRHPFLSYKLLTHGNRAPCSLGQKETSREARVVILGGEQLREYPGVHIWYFHTPS